MFRLLVVVDWRDVLLGRQQLDMKPVIVLALRVVSILVGLLVAGLAGTDE